MLIASAPRTGSTLLCRALWQIGGLGCPKEYLNPMQLRDWSVRLGHSSATRWRHRLLRGPLLALVGPRWSSDRVRAHLRQVIALRTSPTGWFSLKLHAHHARRFYGDQPVQALQPTLCLWVRRRDRLAQAISWVRALQTGAWSARRSLRPPIYSAHALRWALRQIARDEAYWRSVLKQRAPLVLFYEDALEDWPRAIRSVYERAQLPAPAVIPSPSALMSRQRDPLSERWATRFRATNTGFLRDCFGEMG